MNAAINANRTWYEKNYRLVMGLGALVIGLCWFAGQALDEGRAPKGTDAAVAFGMLFDDGAPNTVYAANGTPRIIRQYKAQTAVTCRPHDDPGGWRNEQAYNYDCLATLVAPDTCTVYFPFTASIDPYRMHGSDYLSRPISDEPTALAVLERFKVLKAGANC